MEIQKEKPIFKKILKENFLESAKLTNDCWLSHIGYFLLNENVNSVNCLYDFANENNVEFELFSLYYLINKKKFCFLFKIFKISRYDEGGKKSCISWPSKFEPYLSSFHPSAFFLVSMLKNSIKVKRELQEEEYKASQNQKDIFEDFWGSEEKEQEIKPKITTNLLKEDINQHFIYSLEYYLSVNNPILGLVFYMSNKEKFEITKSIYTF